MTYSEPLDQIVEVSRRLGQDPMLVLHGGGNTSIKGTSRDITGQAIDTVWVKGSGWDLATIEPEGFDRRQVPISLPFSVDGVDEAHLFTVMSRLSFNEVSAAVDHDIGCPARRPQRCGEGVAALGAGPDVGVARRWEHFDQRHEPWLCLR